MPFELHPQLLADCHRLGVTGRCHLLLNRNALVPWFILVPESEVTDLLDLSPDLRTSVLDRAAAVAEVIRQHWGLRKINVAALGNVVPQLHLHVIGRRPGDPCWPKPVWGNLPGTADYSPETLRSILEAVRSRVTGFAPIQE